MCAGNQKSQKTAKRSYCHIHNVQCRPFCGAECPIDDHEDEKYRYRYNDHQPGLRPFLALIFALPLDVVTAGKLNLLTDFVDGIFDSASEIAASNAEPGCDVPLISFPIDFPSLFFFAYLAELCQRNPFPGGGNEPDVCNRLFLIAV